MDGTYIVHSKKFYKNPTFQVLAAIILGGFFGNYAPDLAIEMKPLGDGFIRLIKMVIGPIIFLTIVTGIANVGDIKKVGKIGGKAIIYFEVITTIALILGIVVMNILRPGDGFDTSAASAGTGDITKYVVASQKHTTWVEFLMNIVPENIVGAFVNGDLLQILFISLLFGGALSAAGPQGAAVSASLDKYTQLIFRVMDIIMKAAPIGAFGAISFTIGKFGLASAIPLLKLMGVTIGTMIFFVIVVLGAVARYYRFNIIRFIRYLKDELVTIVGTSSSESVLPVMMEKMQRFGCSKPVVGLVLPTGYSFNLDGSSIYLSMCVLFIAQAYQVDLTFSHQLTILGILLLTSKGAAGVAGSAFIVLAATISATGFLPMEGLALLLGIDRFMSTARALINLIGNAVATVVVAKMEKEFDESMAIEEYRSYFQDPGINSINKL